MNALIRATPHSVTRVTHASVAFTFDISKTPALVDPKVVEEGMGLLLEVYPRAHSWRAEAKDGYLVILVTGVIDTNVDINL